MNDLPPSGSQKLVLIVDDVEDNRIVLDRALRSSGYATLQACSGREALSMISRRRPDIVLLDWMMPDLSGLDTLRAIRDLYSKAQLPVIMCTAMDEEMSVVTALSEGASDYMLKPISLPILRARMSAHLDQRDTIDSLINEKERAESKLGEHTRAMLSAIADARSMAGKGRSQP